MSAWKASGWQGPELHVRLADIAACSLDGLAAFDRDGVLRFMSPAFARLCCFAPAELIGTSAPYTFLEPAAQTLLSAALKSAQAGQPRSFDAVLCTKDKRRVPVRFKVLLLEANSAQDPPCLVAVVRDHSELADLRHAEAHWRSVAQSPFAFVVTVGRDGKFTYVNRVAPGLTQEELIGKLSPADFMEPSQRHGFTQALEQALAGQASYYEAHVSQLDAWFANLVGPVYHEGEVVGATIHTHEITPAKRAERGLFESERRLKLALEGANDGLFDIDLKSGDVFFSARLYQLLGFAPDTRLPALTLAAFKERLHPEDAAHVLELLEVILRTRSTLNAEFRFRGNADGDDYHWFHCRGGFIAEGQGSERFSGFITDITLRKTAEQERMQLEHRVFQLQKIESIGVLAGGIAHDFNNILGPIIGYTELALAQIVDASARDDLSQVLAAAQRAKDLAGQILAFTRKSDQQRRLSRVQDIALESIKFLKASFPATVAIECDVDSNCPPVVTEPTLVHQVITNFCINAYQAMQNSGGVVKVEVSTEDLLEPKEARVGVLRPGRYIRVSVTDTGPGMQDDVMARAFEPYFTTKAPGQGTGMGLAVAQGIVQKLQGAIVVRSTVGVGSTFIAYFPASTEHMVGDGKASTVRAHGSERVLCVDDEAVMVSLFEKTLERLGYAVTAMTSSESALRLFESEPDAFDLIVTDQTMPRLTGVQFARRVSQLRPSLPIIIMTGHSEELGREVDTLSAVRAHLMKPVSTADLALIVRRVLDGA